MPTSSDFLHEIDAQFAQAYGQGSRAIEINAGELHRLVGGYPPEAGQHHAMPSCCQAMWKRFDSSRDREVEVPPSRKGASLTLIYTLPRDA
jgi:hypothetical protein